MTSTIQSTVIPQPESLTRALNPELATNDSSSRRLIYADMLRAFAIMQVIYVHSVSQFLPNLAQSGAWWACLIPEILGRASVPIFLMLSGMFLLQSNMTSPWGFLKKRMGRILLPMAIWSAIFLFWAHFQTGAEVSVKRSFELLQNPAYYHLGYLYFLTGLYLAVPVLKVYVLSAKKQDFHYFIALWIASCALVPALFKLSGISLSIQLVVATHLTGYFVTGYALRNTLVSRLHKLMLFVAGISSCLISAVGTYYLTRNNNGNLDAFIVESASPTIFVYSVCTFLLFKSTDWKQYGSKHPHIIKAGRSISDLSFSMYLVHPIIIDLCTRAGLHQIISKSNFFYTSIKMFIFAVIAIALTWLVVRTAKLLKAPEWLIP